MNDVWNLPQDGEEELPETEGSPEEASGREGSLPSEQSSAVDSTRRTDEAHVAKARNPSRARKNARNPSAGQKKSAGAYPTTLPARPPAPSASSRTGWMTTAKANGRSLSRTRTTTWLKKISGSYSNTQKSGKNSSGSTSRRKNENPSLLRSCFHCGADGASGDWLFVVRHREVFPRRRQDRL